jgi:hypothetical protein
MRSHTHFIENKQSKGVCLYGESRPLEYQPAETTRTGRQWRRKEWGIVLGGLRWGLGREGGGLWWSGSGELIYGTEMGNRQPERRDKVVNVNEYLSFEVEDG